METNPFPAVMGRVCYHPCETACNRGQLDESVGINSVERFLGDRPRARGWTVEVDRRADREARARRRRRPVRALGGVPARAPGPRGHHQGLRAAGRRHDALRHPQVPAASRGARRRGGRILGLGVRLELDTKVVDLASTMAAEGYDAAFLAVGAQVGRRTYIPAGSASHVLDAVSVLHGIEEGERPLLGRRVAVYGGGNTAVDTARTAKRLGAADALVVYRRTRDRMPAHDDEVREAEEEGVRFRWLSTVDHVDADSVTVEQMELDESGFPQPTGRTEVLAADSLVLALGQEADLSLLAAPRRTPGRRRRGDHRPLDGHRPPGRVRGWRRRPAASAR